LIAALALVGQTFNPLPLRAARIGFFPNQRFPHVVWAGIEDPHEQLAALQKAVQSATRKFTVEQPEDKFKGHVTLGRIKRIRRAEAESLANAVACLKESQFGEWTARQINLMKS